ncbi:D-alanyl-D-alanine carboxypeptidase (penicillin-binding protein 5/6) [Thermoanaerobacterium butyriciformans]|uniref:serine-type D-Ala-D-Ala carboxypeptidase n=2 Tax=Thermoanaerobacterium butyriciformans TaxID=1702242 RepID=A0ABS4NG44_9THEO|nr:D-alanyl-D-alanine carboxypeptidase family protein [Thermoanaerobacterium butyriciformans]MBP2072646.1 D-alanyl-D-alanine carboxypeptidase (penicillin-binding protein 5/6) [Thermoanaerobacterium butyriciformans]
MKKTFTFIMAFIFLISFIPRVYAIESPPQIVGPTAVLMDFTTGQVLYDKNMHQKMYPASTTKILTAIIAIEKGKLNDVVTVNDDVKNIDGNSIYLVPGEQLTLEQLLYAMLLESANDAAIAVADHIGGSVQVFADMMNKKAKEIGANDSHFVNPNGLPDNNHYSTPYDMALIARYAMENATFRKIVSTIHYQIPPTNKFDKPRDLWISNRLIKPSSFHYDGADGVKTGYTIAANQVFVGSATRNGHRLISVIMGDVGTNIWSDTIKLLNYGFNNYTLVNPLEKDSIVTYADVGKVKFKLPLIAKDSFYYAVPKGEENNIKSNITLEDNIKAPIKKGAVLGKIDFTFDGKSIGSVQLVADESVYKNYLGTYYNSDGTTIIKDYGTIRSYIELILGLFAILVSVVLWRRKRAKNRFIFIK